MFHSSSATLMGLLILMSMIANGRHQHNMYEPSLCPKIYIYLYDQQKDSYGQRRSPYGEILIAGNYYNTLQLDIELSVGNVVQLYNGNIEPAKPKDEVIEDILNHRPVLYKVLFPAWGAILPKITKIIVNGNLICTGTIIQRGVVTYSDSNGFNPQGYGYNLRPHSYMKNDVIEFNPNHPMDSSIFFPSSTVTTEHENRLSRIEEQADEIRGQLQEEKRSITQAPLRKYVVFNFNPSGPRPKINIKNHPSEKTHKYQLAGVLKKQGVTPYQLNGTQSSIDEPLLAPQRDNIGIGIPSNSYNDFSPKDVKVVPEASQSSRPYSTICGKSVATNPLIINGNDVLRGAFPWLVAIFRVRPTGLNYICCASLISDRHVVTAAHCVIKNTKVLQLSELLIILGKLNIQKWVPSNGEKIVEPESIHVHPDYKEFSSDADVAVLALSEKLEFTQFVRPLCLWNGNSDLKNIIGKQGSVVGWGKDENGTLVTEVPKLVQLPIVSEETCLKSSYQFQHITSNRTFCAGFRDGTGPCNGDSGSGFIIQLQGRWILRGIVSTSISDSGTKTCDLNNYVVFTDASKFNNWFLAFIK